jgi:hypothetical protein
MATHNIFQKRHYEAVATILQGAHATTDYHAWHMICEHFADAFGADSAQFLRHRFMAACAPGANVRARK